jgi:cation:H+ antiporter
MNSDLVILIISLIILVFSGRQVVHYLSRSARYFGISEFSIAFILLAVATSMPELFISISSAVNQTSDIIMAVTLGSNIFNTTLVIGLAAFLSAGISTADLNLRRDVILGTAVTIMPILFLLDGTLNFPEGFLLLSVFTFYMYLLYRDKEKQPKKVKFPHLIHGLVNSFITLIFLVTLLFAADYTVSSSASLAQSLDIPQFFIGLFVLALGTSLPELTLAIQASLARKPGLALGNIIGTNIANSSFVIALAGIASPFKISLSAPLLSTIAFLIIAVITLAIFASSKQRLSTREGLALLGLFVIFIFSSIFSPA